MKLLIDINHPAHVHFFRNFIHLRIKKGDSVIITASDKDIALPLLKEYGLPFYHVGSYGKSLISKLLQIPLMAIKLARIAIKEKPDYMLGIGSSRIAHASIFSKSKVIVFTDTEHAKEQIILYRPFAHKIVTPDSFYLNFGSKQKSYNGLHELAYLHPNYFKPNKDVLKTLPIKKGEPFFILRFVSWDASHDTGVNRLRMDEKTKLISFLEDYGKVFISSEGKLPDSFKKYQLNIPFSEIHNALNDATYYIGEGGTMAIEAAVLGVPSILTNPLKAGVFDQLVNNYELILQSVNLSEILELLENDLEDLEKLKQKQKIKKEKLLEEMTDVTSWMSNFMDNL